MGSLGASLGALFVTLTGNNAGLTATLADSQAQMTGFTSTVEAESLSMGTALTALSLAVVGIGAAVIGGAALMSEGVINTGQALYTMNAETGMSTQNLGAWSVMAQQAGVSTDALGTMFNRFSKNVETNPKYLTELGVSLKDATGAARPLNDVLLDVADKFASMPDSIQKDQLAISLFGRSGAQMVEVLDQGSAGFAAAMATAEQYGTVLSGPQVDALHAAYDAQQDLGIAMQGFEIDVATVFVPILTTAVTWVTNNVIPALKDFATWLSNNQWAMDAFGKVILLALSYLVTGVVYSMITALVGLAAQAATTALGLLGMGAAADTATISFKVLASSTGIGALVVVIGALLMFQNPITDFFGSIIADIQAFIISLENTIPFLTQVLDLLGQLGNSLGLFQSGGGSGLPGSVDTGYAMPAAPAGAGTTGGALPTSGSSSGSKAAAENWSSDFTTAFDAVKQAALDYLSAVHTATTQQITDQEDVLQNQIKQRDLTLQMQQDAEKQTNLQDALKAAQAEVYNSAIDPLRAQDDIKKAQQALTDFQASEAVKTQDNADNAQIDALKAQQTAEDQQYNDQVASFNREIGLLEDQLKTGQMTQQQGQDAITKLLASYGVTYAGIGATLGQDFATSIEGKVVTAATAASHLADKTTSALGAGAVAAGVAGDLTGTAYRNGLDSLGPTINTQVQKMMDGVLLTMGAAVPKAKTAGITLGSAFKDGLSLQTIGAEIVAFFGWIHNLGFGFGVEIVAFFGWIHNLGVGFGAEIINILSGVLTDLSNLPNFALQAGKNLMSALGQGIQDGIGGLRSILGNVGNTITGFLKILSPAKEGPLAEDQSQWGYNLARAWGKGLERGMAGINLSASLGAIASGLQTGAGAAGSTSVGGSVYNLNFAPGSVRNDNDIFRLAREIDQRIGQTATQRLPIAYVPVS